MTVYTAGIEAGIDIETTGLEIGDHRIIEVYVGLFRDEQLLGEFETRIDPQRSIALDAQRVHGISPADLIGKPLWSAVAPKLVKWLAKADVYVWHNGDSFDGPFLEYEFRREGIAMPKRKSIDTMSCVWATPDGKKPSLKELCFATGVEYIEAAGKAHSAPYDVRDTLMPAYFRAKRWGFIEVEEKANQAA